MIQHVQVLRFLAAFWVVLFHAQAPTVPAELLPPWLPAWQAVMQAGFAGVDIFVVISGAIMAEATRPLAPGARSAARFIAVRFSRIYIGWWPFFLLYLLAYGLHGSLREQVQLAGSFFLWPLPLDGYLVPLLWTLSFELYFYLVVGLLLLLPRPLMLRLLWCWAAAVLIFLAVNLQSGMYQPQRFGETGLWHQVLGFPLVLEFIAGFLLCEWLRRRPQTPWWPFAMGAVVLAAAAAAYQTLGGLHASGLAGYYHGPERTLLLGGAACGLVACALLWRPPQNGLVLALARLGEASYALYLGHLLVLVVSYYLALQLGPPAWLLPVLYLLALSGTTAYAWLHFRWIERPLYRRARHAINRLLP